MEGERETGRGREGERESVRGKGHMLFTFSFRLVHLQQCRLSLSEHCIVS